MAQKCGTGSAAFLVPGSIQSLSAIFMVAGPTDRMWRLSTV